MYLPYLRARQYELIALRELIEKNLIGDNIIPIIEPIKLSPTLMKTLNAFINKGRKIVVIHNPKVGNFLKELSDNSKEVEFRNLLLNKNIIVGHIINKKSGEELEKLKEYGFNTILIINNDINYLNIYTIATKSFNPVLTLIPDESLFRRKVNVDKILLADRFNKRDRNSDYIDLDDEIFTEDHLYYSNEGYKGFSDYSIIGNNFSESGFAPYAVAIHIVYFDEDNYLKIRHFVSTSNDDIRNPAKKFYEAVTKLCDCKSIFNNESYALKEFRKYHKDGGYPGLGTVKKLSLMHHLEIMSQYLDGVK